MEFPPFLVKQLYRCNSIVISSFVRTGYTARRWGWLLGRIQHVNRMPRNRLSRIMKHYSPTGRRNHGSPLKRLLDTWDRNGSTSGPSPWEIYDDDDYLSIHISERVLCSLQYVKLLTGYGGSSSNHT
jgi:hypothetical protein